MASNFKIFRHVNGDSLHINLRGDFDGSSAYELIRALKKSFAAAHRIFVNTSELKRIYPFGCGVFQGKLGLPKNQMGSLIFTGENAALIAPAGSRVKLDAHTPKARVVTSIKNPNIKFNRRDINQDAVSG
ncbi:MAG: hypothetical protein SV487_04670 [Thermodesulfobacteriota bacterium]|nr:hypothetical protein [Thermodesulfobacteriota bacterium]